MAGVKTAESGPVIGFVERKSLKSGTVGENTQPLAAERLISDATSLPSVLAVLKRQQHVFVVIGPQVSGIVTRADLNKPPVRVYLFGLISLLEMHLGFWVRAAYGEDSWKAKLKESRLKAARKVQADARKLNQEPILVDCLQFCDKRDLIVACDELRAQLSLGTKNKAQKLFKRAEDMRNCLAHSQQELVQASSWAPTIELVESLEKIVQTSDQLVEEKAGRSAGRGDQALWTSV